MGGRFSDPTIEELLLHELNDLNSHWSIGTFGAIAEFCHLPEDDMTVGFGHGKIAAVTGRGGISICLNGNWRPFASESIAWQGWSQRVALCMNTADAMMHGRVVLTELSADHDALRQGDRDDVLFDLGLGAPHVDFCIRVRDESLKNRLRRYTGLPLYGSENPALAAILDASPHRVFISKAGRIEVFQRIPAHGEKSPKGPHTHVLPRLLKQQRTHSATEPVPSGKVPCAHVYPWHPANVALGETPSFDGAQHHYFQNIMRSFGDARALATKARVCELVGAEKMPPNECFAESRIDRANIRIALRQLRAANFRSRTLAQWIAVYDRLNDETVEFEQDSCVPVRRSVPETV